MRHLRVVAISIFLYQILAIFILDKISNLELPVVNTSRLSTRVLAFFEATTPIKSKELAIKSNLVISNMILNGDKKNTSDIVINGITAYQHINRFLMKKWEKLDNEDRFELLMEELIILNRLRFISNDIKIKDLQISTYKDTLNHRHSATPHDSQYLEAEAILTLRQHDHDIKSKNTDKNIHAIKMLYSGIISCENGEEQGALDIDYFTEHYGKTRADMVFFISRNWNTPLLIFLSKTTPPKSCLRSLNNIIEKL